MLIRFQFGMLIVSLRSRLFVSGLLRLEPRLWLKHRYRPTLRLRAARLLPPPGRALCS